MLDEAPHILHVCTVTPLETDEYGKPVKGTGGETWELREECFCHDNTQMKQISVNGELWTYNYHVVYEGRKVELGAKIRCTDKEMGDVIGEGSVVKVAGCYSSDFKGRYDLWL